MKLGFIRYAPAAVFLALTALTALVARQQLSYERALLADHTAVVSLQSAQRLEAFVEARLKIVEIFAQRWATHEERDFSRQRFEEFASVLVERVPGYHSVELLDRGGGPLWRVPQEVEPLPRGARQELRRLVHLAEGRNESVLSPPLGEGEGAGFFALRALRRGEELLGFVLVRFETSTLIDRCFDERLRREFALWIHDRDQLLYRHGSEVDRLDEVRGTPRAEREFEIRNRRWRLSMALRSEFSTSWSLIWPVVLLGLVLSLGMTGLTASLIRKLELVRQAHERVLREASAREKAQRALVDTEARYRSVFESASDGLVVLDADGVIVEANRAAFLMLDSAPGQLRGRRFPELVSSGCPDLWDEFTAQLQLVGTARTELVLERVDGDALDLDLRGASFSFAGEPRILALMSDVTDRKRAERRHELLAGKVLVAQEEERARISRELHDELGQLLTAIRFELGLVAKHSASVPDDAARALDSAVGLIERSATELRHICKRLRPPLLDDLGLEPAVRQLVEDFSAHTGLEVDEEIEIAELDVPLPTEVSLCVYRVLQESLTNVGRHAGAKSVVLELRQKTAELVLSVYDDGQGFETSDLPEIEGSGMTGMRERAHLVGGRLDISSAPFQGTRIELRVPLREAQLEEAT